MYVEKIGLTGSLFSIFLVECTFVLSEKYLTRIRSYLILGFALSFLARHFSSVIFVTADVLPNALLFLLFLFFSSTFALHTSQFCRS